ncbi:RNA recognition domain-containing protein [Stagonosporopsis vannaccii]|nr:RNA recognition domain-containing protein [Stagonosporopsis vannaccii]
MSSTVHVENISTKTSEDEIKSFFSFCGKIQDISVKSTGGDTQSASVTFEKAAAAKTALLLDSTQLGPNSVHVKSAGGDSTTEKSAADDTHEGDHISQEQKPRARIVAEYLAHGYVISDKAIESALAADKQHGYSAKFLQTLQNIDSKTQASQKAQAVDQKLGISNKALGAWAGLTSYFDKAQGTPTGQKLRAFYDQGNKTVMDVHNEARHLADLKKKSTGSDGKPSKEEADVHSVGDGKTQCNCGSVSGKCPCPEGQCACSGCAKAEDGGKPSKEEANVHGVGDGKTQCNCGSVSGKCPCPEGQCACSGCAKAEGGGKPSVEEANVHEVGNGKTQCNCGSVSGKCPCPEGKCACSGCAKDTSAGDASYAAVADPKQ